MAAQKQKRPVFTARSGRLSVSVWLNEGQKGDYYQVARRSGRTTETVS